MRNSIKIISLGFLILSGIATGCSSEDTNTDLAPSLKEGEILLRYFPTKGDVYAVKMDMDMKMGGETGMKMNLMMDMDYNIGEVSSDDSYYNTSVIRRVNMNMKMAGMDISYDSDSEDQKGMAAKMHQMYSEIIDVDLKSKTDNKGLILENPNFDEIFGNNEAIKKQMGESMEKMNNSNIEYPEEALSVGSSWNLDVNSGGKFPILIKSIYTVSEITEFEVKLSISGDMILKSDTSGIKGLMIGESILDRKTGFLKSMTMKQNMKMAMPGGEMDMKNNMKMTMIKK